MELVSGTKVELTQEEFVDLLKIFVDKKRAEDTVVLLRQLAKASVEAVEKKEDVFFGALAKRLGADEAEWGFEVDDEEESVTLYSRQDHKAKSTKEAVEHRELQEKILKSLKDAFGDKVVIMQSTDLKNDS